MAGVQAATSGCTNVLPAPVIVVSLLFAPAAATEASATRATAMRASPLFICSLSLSLGCRRHSSPDAARCGLTPCDHRVTKWLLALQAELLPRALEQQARGQARHEHEEDQHERGRPRLLVQRRVCRLRVEVDRERDRLHGMRRVPV